MREDAGDEDEDAIVKLSLVGASSRRDQEVIIISTDADAVMPCPRVERHSERAGGRATPK